MGRGQDILKVALICDDLMIGGWSSLASIIPLLPQRGIDPVVICIFGKGHNAEALKKQGIPVHCCYMTKFNFVWTFFRLVALLKKEKCDIVHTQLDLSHIIGQFAALLAGIKARVMHVHSMAGRTKGFSGLIKSFLVRRVSLVIPVSNGAAGIFRTSYPEYKNKIKVIHNCIDVAKLRCLSAKSHLKKEDFSIPPDSFTVVTVANLKWEKAHKDLVAAARILNDENIHFLWVGDGPERKTLEKMINEEGLEKQFHLTGKRPDIAEILSFCDISVLPSEREAFGISIIESYAAGIPVITTDIDGIREIAFNNENSITIPPGSPEKLAEAIKYMKDNPELRMRIAASASDFVNRFSCTDILPEYENAYRSVVDY